MTYTNDQRFQSIHADGSDEWILKITSPQPRDSGIYECQVSTEPKISQAFRITVVGKQSNKNTRNLSQKCFFFYFLVFPSLLFVLFLIEFHCFSFPIYPTVKIANWITQLVRFTKRPNWVNFLLHCRYWENKTKQKVGKPIDMFLIFSFSFLFFIVILSHSPQWQRRKS